MRVKRDEEEEEEAFLWKLKQMRSLLEQPKQGERVRERN